ncbi:TPA: DUF1642 domain-containing protein [Listeria monocytogenes]|nr:DUF1642 domain-containing protein [Listeria monocytogenes]
MSFKVGDEVQFITSNELVVGTIKHMSSQVGWVDMQASDSRCFFRKLKDVAKVKEPVLVAVPRFVADWIEQKKANGDHLYIAMDKTWECMNGKVSAWLEDGEDKYDKFARAWLDGYEVEKEAKCESENLFIIEIDKGIRDSAMWIRSFETTAKELQYTIAHSKEDALTGDKLSMTTFACFLATHNSRHTYTVVPMNEAAE